MSFLLSCQSFGTCDFGLTKSDVKLQGNLFICTSHVQQPFTQTVLLREKNFFNLFFSSLEKSNFFSTKKMSVWKIYPCTVWYFHPEKRALKILLTLTWEYLFWEYLHRKHDGSYTISLNNKIILLPITSYKD